MSHTVMVFADPERVLALSSDKKEEDRWKGFLNNLPSELKKAGKIQRLSENCWLIPMQSDLQAFCSLVAHAHGFRVPTKTVFFDSEPQFIATP